MDVYCDVLFPARCLSYLVMSEEHRNRGVTDGGEVSVSYYSLINTSTFPFWGNTVISAHRGLLGSSHTNADAGVCGRGDSAAQSTLSHRSKCWYMDATLARA